MRQENGILFMEWNIVYISQTAVRDVTSCNTFSLGENSGIFYSHFTIISRRMIMSFLNVVICDTLNLLRVSHII